MKTAVAIKWLMLRVVESSRGSLALIPNLAPGNYYNRLWQFNHPKAFNYSFRIMDGF